MASQRAAAAASTRFRSAVRKLSRDGVDALRPQQVPVVATTATAAKGPGIDDEQRTWRKPAISKRVAKVLRKDAIRSGTYGSFDAETGTGWDPSWDAALLSSSGTQQNRYRITVPKTAKRHRTREQRAQRIEKKLDGMDERIEEYYAEKHESKPPKTFENEFKNLMKGTK